MQSGGAKSATTLEPVYSKVRRRPWTSWPLCEGLETEPDQLGGESVCQKEPDYLNQRLGGNPVRWEGYKTALGAEAKKSQTTIQKAGRESFGQGDGIRR